MKNAMFKTTLMMFVVTAAVTVTNSVVALAKSGSAATAKQTVIKKLKKKSAAAAVSGRSSVPISGKAKLSNDMVFDGSVVRGQYQIADGTTSVVENEKSLTSLLAPRRDFKDRMQAERSEQ